MKPTELEASTPACLGQVELDPLYEELPVVVTHAPPPSVDQPVAVRSPGFTSQAA